MKEPGLPSPSWPWSRWFSAAFPPRESGSARSRRPLPPQSGDLVASADETHAHASPQRHDGAQIDQDAVRRAIVDAAADLFGRHGVDAVSLRQIASAADVRLGDITRHVGNRAELIDAVFDDVSSQLAHELLDQPFEVPTFDRDTTLGRWMAVLNHFVHNGVDVGTRAGPFNPVLAVATLAEERYGLDPFDARIRGAQIVAHALGWRLFEAYLVAAGGLESTPIETLRDEYGTTNRRLGATPLRTGREATTLRPVVPEPPRARDATYDSVLAHFEREVIQRVHADLRGQDVVLVHGRLITDLHNRLPGDPLDERKLWQLAEAIANDALPPPPWTVRSHNGAVTPPPVGTAWTPPVNS
jgi:TetR/AcrR family transcriptional regulator, repressor for neighboring sulfatase